MNKHLKIGAIYIKDKYHGLYQAMIDLTNLHPLHSFSLARLTASAWGRSTHPRLFFIQVQLVQSGIYKEIDSFLGAF